MMQELANSAIETAKRRGASYADVRVMDIRHRDISTKNGEVGTLAEAESLGIGIRVIAGGAWGFSSTDRLTSEGVQACAAEAVAIAKASALAKRENVSLAPEKTHVDTWQNPFLKDPFRIPVEQQIDLLLAADKEMRRVKGVTVAEGSMSFRRIEQLFASSTGSSIHQVKMQSGAGIVATSFAGTEIQKRSYPNSFGGQHMLQGYELVESLDLAGNAGRIAEECVALHSAAQCPEGQHTIILGSSQLGLQIHESIGHPIELGNELSHHGKAAQIKIRFRYRQRRRRRTPRARAGPGHVRLRR
jgi:TldD protein